MRSPRSCSTLRTRCQVPVIALRQHLVRRGDRAGSQDDHQSPRIPRRRSAASRARAHGSCSCGSHDPPSARTALKRLGESNRARRCCASARGVGWLRAGSVDPVGAWALHSRLNHRDPPDATADNPEHVCACCIATIKLRNEVWGRLHVLDVDTHARSAASVAVEMRHQH